MSEETTEQEANTGMWKRLKSGLAKTRAQLAEGVGSLVLGEREIDASVMEELETALLLTDVGVETTQSIMEELSGRVARRELSNTVVLHGALKTLLVQRLKPLEKALEITAKPHVIFFVGVNGVGKTTTIGKLAKQLQQQGKSVLLAAADTFRAAAVEQLQAWGERNRVAVIAQGQGADSASVAYDAVQAAQARGVDVLLVDTAGRLQVKEHLMDELKKIHRVVKRLDEKAPHDVILVLDGGVGQNAISQVRLFSEAVNVSGLIVSKLDGTAKAGVVFAVAAAIASDAAATAGDNTGEIDASLPIHYVGIGEGVDDLRAFSAENFVAALLEEE